MNTHNLRKTKIDRRKYKIKTANAKNHPVLCIYKSNKHISLQLVCPVSKTTLISSTDMNLKKQNPQAKVTLTDVLKDFESKLIQQNEKQPINKITFYFRDHRHAGKIKKITQYINNVQLQTSDRPA